MTPAEQAFEKYVRTTYPLGYDSDIQASVSKRAFLTAFTQGAREERGRMTPLMDALRPLVTQWHHSGKQTADRKVVSEAFYDAIRHREEGRCATPRSS